MSLKSIRSLGCTLSSLNSELLLGYTLIIPSIIRLLLFYSFEPHFSLLPLLCLPLLCHKTSRHRYLWVYSFVVCRWIQISIVFMILSLYLLLNVVMLRFRTGALYCKLLLVFHKLFFVHSFEIAPFSQDLDSLNIFDGSKLFSIVFIAAQRIKAYLFTQALIFRLHQFQNI